MPFIGNQPALSYTSFAKQDFTTSATTSYTLDNPVANENEIALFINFVRQEPTTAYTASGTSLTLTSATSASDDMYCVFLGKAVQTVNPPSGSVDTAQLTDSSVTSAKLSYPLTTFSSTGIDDNATSTAITIDSNEVVRIGNTSDTYSPTYTEHMVIGNYNADENHGITFLSDLDNTFTLGFADDGHSTLRGAIKYSHLNDFMTFHAFADVERMRLDKNGNLQFNSGYGSVATAYACRAWANFDGTGTPSIRDSGNVSSVTDDAVGRYNVNFSNAMPDVNYAAVVTAGESIFHVGIARQTGSSTTVVQVDVSDYIAETYTDDTSIKVVVIR